MPRKSLLTAEQIAKSQEMLKAGAKVSDIAEATGAKDYQINQIKKRMGLVKSRKATRKAATAAKPGAATGKTRSVKAKASSELSVNDIRAKLEAAQKEVARWQQLLVERVTEIEKMIATIKKS